jgi:hypothetical protein
MVRQLVEAVRASGVGFAFPSFHALRGRRIFFVCPKKNQKRALRQLGRPQDLRQESDPLGSAPPDQKYKSFSGGQIPTIGSTFLIVTGAAVPSRSASTPLIQG